MVSLMHKFMPVDAHILVGLFYADKQAKNAEISCLEIVASCWTINPAIPVLAEFASAFNKFLYARIINLDENKLSLTNFGRQLVQDISNSNETASTPDKLVTQLATVLAGYKLKSMCNRTIWTALDYQQAVDAQQNNL